VQNYGESVGTVVEYERLGVKRGARIMYSFASSDNKVHWGSVREGLSLPKVGESLAIVYNVAHPSLNYPLSSFEFYAFRFQFSDKSSK
jgi:hypothetical protein